MKSPAPSTHAAVVIAKREIKAEIVEICKEIRKYKDLRSIVFVAKLPPKQERNYIQLPDGSYDARYKRKDYKK